LLSFVIAPAMAASPSVARLPGGGGIIPDVDRP